MSATELPLRDIHLPEAISAWPPAIGWWILALLIPLSLFLLFKGYRHLTRKTALKSAKQHFKVLQAATELTPQQQLQALSSLMRRSAVSLYPQQEVSSLTGVAWIEFLNQHSKNNEFDAQLGDLLNTALYRPPTEELELSALFKACASWLNHQQET